MVQVEIYFHLNYNWLRFCRPFKKKSFSVFFFFHVLLNCQVVYLNRKFSLWFFFVCLSRLPLLNGTYNTKCRIKFERKNRVNFNTIRKVIINKNIFRTLRLMLNELVFRLFFFYIFANCGIIVKRFLLFSLIIIFFCKVELFNFNLFSWNVRFNVLFYITSNELLLIYSLGRDRRLSWCTFWYVW